ncbi:UNVERIFIED_ORG: hypothetical protein FHU01_4465 [Citrobacter freundii]
MVQSDASRITTVKYPETLWIRGKTITRLLSVTEGRVLASWSINGVAVEVTRNNGARVVAGESVTLIKGEELLIKSMNFWSGKKTGYILLSVTAV